MKNATLVVRFAERFADDKDLFHARCFSIS
jgi:hypothetical protein